MGYISELAAQSLPRPRRAAKDLPRRGDEDSAPRRKRDPRSLSSTEQAYRQLLFAFRSLAPGNWSDDRWEQSNHFTGIQYVGIHRISEQMAQAEFQVFREDVRHPDGKRPVTPNDPPHEGRRCRPYDLVRLLQRPNRDDSFGDLLYRWNTQMQLTGTALTWVVPNVFGTPMELFPVPTAIAQPQPPSPEHPEGAYRVQPFYPYGFYSAATVGPHAVGAVVPAQWFLRFQYPHPFLRYDGYSPLTALRLHIDEVESIDRSRWYAQFRGLAPSAVLNFTESEGAEPLPEEEIERIRAEFESEYSGPDNAAKLLIATPGAELVPWGNRPIDMDYQSGWEQLVSFVLAGLGITKPAAGMIETSNYAVLWAALKQLHLLTLGPNCARIGGKLTRHLAPHFGDGLIVEVRCPRIDDHELKLAKIGKALEGKALTKGELRKELDLPLWGDERDDELAGTEPQQQQPGAGGGMAPPPGFAAPGQDQGGPPDDSLADILGGEEEEDPDAEANRPDSGPLGAGALGPRKGIAYHAKRARPHRNGRVVTA